MDGCGWGMGGRRGKEVRTFQGSSTAHPLLSSRSLTSSISSPNFTLTLLESLSMAPNSLPSARGSTKAVPSSSIRAHHLPPPFPSHLADGSPPSLDLGPSRPQWPSGFILFFDPTSAHAVRLGKELFLRFLTSLPRLPYYPHPFASLLAASASPPRTLRRTGRTSSPRR